MTTIVDKLLSVARLDAGDLQLELAPVDVRSLVSEVVDTLARRRASTAHEFVARPARGAAAGAHRLRTSFARCSSTSSTTRCASRPAAGRSRSARDGAARRSCSASPTRASAFRTTEQERIFSKFYRVGDAQTGGTGRRPVHRAGPGQRARRTDHGSIGRGSWLELRRRAAGPRRTRESRSRCRTLACWWSTTRRRSGSSAGSISRRRRWRCWRRRTGRPGSRWRARSGPT